MVWEDRKRLWCGLPWTFTKYSFDNERLFIERGFLNQRSDEVRLYRVTDISLVRTFWQRIFGIGTLHLNTVDKTLGNFSLVNIKCPKEVKELLSTTVEQQRDKKRVSSREVLFSNADSDDSDDDDEDDENN